MLFLGTGTSHGVPMIGCDCAVCQSADPRDKRCRSSILLGMDDGLNVLVDTTPDLRMQALRSGLRQVDAILYTHAHADHLMGLDDVRRFNALSKKTMPVYGDAATLADIRRTFGYVFSTEPTHGGGVPNLQLWPIGGPFCLGRQEVVPVPVKHGPWDVLGFRMGTFAYLTDCSAIPDRSMAMLSGVRTVVLDALRRRPHPTHFTLDQAIEMSRRIGATETYFTHIAHDLGHAAVSSGLPAGMALAWDGLQVEC